MRSFGKRLHRDIEFPGSMGLMIENTGLWNEFTAFENLAFLADIHGKIHRKGIIAALERVGLKPMDKRKYKTFSMGMRQKLALAQAIMEKPMLILLDEPTNGLDEESVQLFRQIICEERQRGATCIIATHQREDIAGLSDRSFLMKDGRCISLD